MNQKQRNAVWEARNGYQRIDLANCLHCAFFKIDDHAPIVGDCELKVKEGAYRTVCTNAVCQRFISRLGKDITPEGIGGVNECIKP